MERGGEGEREIEKRERERERERERKSERRRKQERERRARAQGRERQSRGDVRDPPAGLERETKEHIDKRLPQDLSLNPFSGAPTEDPTKVD